MSATIVPFQKPSRQPSPTPNATRYTPTMFSDGSAVLISAERHRQIDAEVLCERLTDDFIGMIRLMTDDELAILEVLAEGVFHTSSDDDGGRLAEAAKRFTASKSKRGGAA